MGPDYNTHLQSKSSPNKYKATHCKRYAESMLTSEISSSEIQSNDGVGEGVSLVDGHGVGDTISGVHHDASRSSRGVQRQHSLDVDIHSRAVECLEHYLGHLFPVSLWVQGSLSQQHGVLFGGHSQLIVKRVVPNLFHVIPVGHDSMLNGIFQSQDTSFALSFISDIRVFLAHSNHHTLVSRPSHDRGEHGSRCIVTYNN